MASYSTSPKPSLNITTIFRSMMEEGFYPSYEDDYIKFMTEGNIAVVEYLNGILSVRMFFSIDEEGYELFLEASNATMLETQMVKPVILPDMANIMFSCEIFCNNVREFKRMFPRAVELLNNAFETHKKEMRQLIKTAEIVSATIPATESSATGIVDNKRAKLLS